MTIILPKYTGPGPQTLIGQYTDPNNPSRQHGFFGEVASDEFISGDALASAIGLIAGISQNSTTSWLKFYIDGGIIYVPKKPIRHTVSWQDIYQAGAVYGDNTTGLHPAGTARVQDTQVTIGEDTYKVMLLKGANSNPVTDEYGYDVAASHGSEWNRLFYNIATTIYSDKASQEGDQWVEYTDDDLGTWFFEDVGAYNWCIEQSVAETNCRVIRGHSGVSYLLRLTVTNAHVNYGWRPKLELVL
ncbi:MAG: hypothetical protein WC981_03570 [Candidatus Dojkabacteria bacterium]